MLKHWNQIKFSMKIKTKEKFNLLSYDGYIVGDVDKYVMEMIRLYLHGLKMLHHYLFQKVS
jgi:hypothetical protein